MCLGMANGGKQVANDGKKFFTDKEITKALECCGKNHITGSTDACEHCFLQNSAMCVTELIYKSLDLINRLKGDVIHYRRKAQNQKQELSRLNAEIERLNSCVKSEDEVRAIANATIQAGIKIIKATTIKELEAKIHEKLHEAEMHGNFEPVVTREMFDSVVKELVGEGNG
jgi:hypothetical protein